ncbi:hypothetical protein [Acinetobacter indicus]|uniref:hypothetical protein n=1 Tax=Acinetobacter indicus TaxID=756892 RepID=UPI003989E3C9
MKTLDLGMNWKGGLPAVYARNVMDHGDYATVAFVVGSTKGEIVENGQYMIDLISDFNKPEYLEQVKAYLKSINASISFTNDQPHGSFVDPQEVLNKANELYKLMNFEKRLILENLDQLHLVYISAIKNNKQPELPQEFNYQVMSGGLYPFRQVYSAVCALMQE